MRQDIKFIKVDLEHNAKLNCIYNVIKVYLRQQKLSLNCITMWDTGSYYSLFTDALVERYNLKSDNLIQVKQPGKKIKKNYLFNVDLHLTDKLILADLKVSHADIMHYDFVIGMDVIKRGNLKLINIGNRKEYAFYYPIN